jgi:hypothetical protein
MFSLVPLEIIVRNKVPARIFSLATVFKSVIYRETYFIAHILLPGAFFSATNFQ